MWSARLIAGCALALTACSAAAPAPSHRVAAKPTPTPAPAKPTTVRFVAPPLVFYSPKYGNVDVWVRLNRPLHHNVGEPHEYDDAASSLSVPGAHQDGPPGIEHDALRPDLLRPGSLPREERSPARRWRSGAGDARTGPRPARDRDGDHADPEGLSPRGGAPRLPATARHARLPQRGLSPGVRRDQRHVRHRHLVRDRPRGHAERRPLGQLGLLGAPVRQQAPDEPRASAATPGSPARPPGTSSATAGRPRSAASPRTDHGRMSLNVSSKPSPEVRSVPSMCRIAGRSSSVQSSRKNAQPWPSGSSSSTVTASMR